MCRTILIVDDEVIIRKLLSVAFHAKGHRLLMAADGEEALRMAKSHPGTLDLLIVDICLPDTDGFSLSRRISGLRPEVKTLFISGYSDEETAVRFGAAEMVVFETHFCAKPFVISDFVRKVESILSGTARRGRFPRTSYGNL